MNLWTGVVENRGDPLKLGRCQVRIVGLHTHDKTILPTEDLPWAFPLQPINSAAMNGIGVAPVGVVEGTWVVLMFRDDDHQQPIILGTIGGIPQKEQGTISTFSDDSVTIEGPTQKIEQTPRGSVLVTTDGGTVTDGSGNPVKVEASPVGKILENSTKPVTGSAVPPASAKRGIAALNKAMDEAGFMGKYGRAALLGIAGGESAWVPKSEGFDYSAAALRSVFSKVITTDELAKKYARWTGTRESFFEFIYGYTSPIGKELGNKNVGDGGKYHGRGFIQLTGLSNYTRYARLSGVDIVGNPDILNNDIEASARVAVAYFRDRVPVDPADPRYFQTALKRVGGAKSGFPKKEAFYNYFLGEATPPPEQTDKSTNPAAPAAQNVPIGASGLPEDRENNVVVGFTDPNMKYPLRDYIGEPDTNRLARGKIDGTVVELKDEKILKDIPLPKEQKWTQPDVAYGAKYPYNKVMETESGHLMEFDDSPNYERIHLYHRKGTYLEIDPNGTQVNRIVGDGYSILERNGYVVIAGKCNVTIVGEANLMVQNDVNIQIEGDTNIVAKGDVNMGIAGNFNVNVGGDYKVKVKGNTFVDSTGDINYKSAANVNTEAASNVNSKAGGTNKVSGGGAVDVNAGGRLSLDGSVLHLGNGAANADSAASSGIEGEAPERGVKSETNLEQLKPPPRNLEEEIAYETPEENEDPKAKEYHSERKTETTSQESTTVAAEEKPKNEVVPTSADCNVIFGMPSFPDSYVLHTDGTGFKWTVGILRNGKTITPGKYGLGLSRGTKDMSIQEIVCNMKALAVNICGPINEMIGPLNKNWYLNSAYRNDIPKGGSPTSQHLSGSAIDISPGGNYAYKLNYDWAVKLAAVLPYDQFLLEYRDPGVNGNRNPKRINWIHISYNNYGPPKRDLRTFLNDKTHTNGSLVLLA